MIRKIKAVLEKPIRLPTFAKRALYAMLVLWFVGAIYGMGYCFAELVISVFVPGYTIHLAELLAYIGAPVGCGLVGYLCKSALESNQAMKQEYIKDYETVILGDGEEHRND